MMTPLEAKTTSLRPITETMLPSMYKKWSTAGRGNNGAR